jgi:hypothetical protein
MATTATPPKTSPCHGARIDASLGDGVLMGSCHECGEPVVRLNPDTAVYEWLDGKSPWTREPLRPVA